MPEPGENEAGETDLGEGGRRIDSVEGETTPATKPFPVWFLDNETGRRLKRLEGRGNEISKRLHVSFSQAEATDRGRRRTRSKPQLRPSSLSHPSPAFSSTLVRPSRPSCPPRRRACSRDLPSSTGSCFPETAFPSSPHSTRSSLQRPCSCRTRRASKPSMQTQMRRRRWDGQAEEAVRKGKAFERRGDAGIGEG
jgi:hypothetical protein